MVRPHGEPLIPFDREFHLSLCGFGSLSRYRVPHLRKPRWESLTPILDTTSTRLGPQMSGPIVRLQVFSTSVPNVKFTSCDFAVTVWQTYRFNFYRNNMSRYSSLHAKFQFAKSWIHWMLVHLPTSNIGECTRQNVFCVYI